MPAPADAAFLARALELAREAESAGDVPVGAVIVRPDHVVAAECLAQELDEVLGRVYEAASVFQPVLADMV